MNIGDKVRIRPDGKTVFVIVDLDNEHAIIESVGEEPGKYPFSLPATDLIPE